MKSKLCGKEGEQASCARLCLRTQGVLFFCLVLLLHQIRRTLCLPPPVSSVLHLFYLCPPLLFHPVLHRGSTGHIFTLPVFSNNMYPQPASELPGSGESSSFTSIAYFAFKKQRVKPGSSGKRPSVMSQTPKWIQFHLLPWFRPPFKRGSFNKASDFLLQAANRGF